MARLGSWGCGACHVTALGAAEMVRSGPTAKQTDYGREGADKGMGICNFIPTSLAGVAIAGSVKFMTAVSVACVAVVLCG